MGAVPKTILISARGRTYPFDPTHQLGGITSMDHSVVSDSDKKCCPSCSDPKDAGMTGSEAEPIKTIENWCRMKKTKDNFITTFSSASLRQS